MIRLEDIGKTYDVRRAAPVTALQGIDLEIGRGEAFGVIGRSGAGKSTLVRLINLLERPTRGRVLVDGEDLTALPPAELRRARRSIGMIFQHFNLLSSRSVFDNVALPLELTGTPRREIAQAVEPLLDLVGLTDQRGRYPAQLSGGQKQRVGIARALANRPKVLLCDEATSALDPETTASILRLLADINARLGLTIVLITHEMAVIKEIAHRVAVLDQGRVVEQGPTLDLFAAPQHEATRRLVAAAVGQELPPGLGERLRPDGGPGDHPVLRITFRGAAADQPVISRLSRQHGLDINILHGRIDPIGGASFGVLVVEAIGEPAQVQAAIAALRNDNLNVEILGHVPATLRAAG